VKIRTVIGLVGATAASLVGLAGLAAGPAGAGGNGAVNLPAGDLSSYLGIPGIPVFGGFYYPGEPGLPFTVPPNVKVSGNCVSDALWVFNDPVALNFLSGTAVLYRGTNPTNGLPNGLNAVGTAMFFDLANPDAPTFVGPAHVWFGQNGNAQGQFYQGATFSFSGTAADGSTISFTENPGGITSAHMNHQGGWGQQNLSCNIVSGG
jgi:hypothetical protein